MQQKQAFSFGYKNLIQSTSDNPGPGHYYFNQSSINIAKVRKHSSTRKVVQIQIPDQILEIPAPKIYRSNFARSARNEICFTLPTFSKGPQHYNINHSMGKPSSAIDIAKYSGRKSDYSTHVPGVGTYDPQEVKITQEKQQNQKSVDPFRKLSYLTNTLTNLGPCSYDPKNNVEIQGYEFSKADRIYEDTSNQACVGEYNIQDQLKYKYSPKYSFSKHVQKFESSYLQRKKFMNQTPDASSYNSTKSLKTAVWANRSNKFSSNSRNLIPLKTYSGPGPGSYDPYLISRKKDTAKEYDSYILSQKIIGVKHDFTDYESKDQQRDSTRLKNPNQKKLLGQLTQNQSNLSINKECQNQKSFYQSNSEKSYQNYIQLGGEASKSIRYTEQSLKVPRQNLFRISETPDKTDLSSIFNKHIVKEKKRLGKQPEEISTYIEIRFNS